MRLDAHFFPVVATAGIGRLEIKPGVAIESDDFKISDVRIREKCAALHGSAKRVTPICQDS